MGFYGRMDRIVALKVLPRDMIRSPDALERFQQEVRSAAKLIHPNVAAAFDAGEQDDTPFLPMEHIEGRDLFRYVRERGPLAVDRAVDYVSQAARGLDYAPGQGILH